MTKRLMTEIGLLILIIAYSVTNIISVYRINGVIAEQWYHIAFMVCYIMYRLPEITKDIALSISKDKGISVTLGD